MTILHHILGGFATLADPMLILTLTIGFFIGLMFSVIPGLTATLAIVLLLPLTYSMSMNAALAAVMGIYMAGMYGGSITAITINIPGAPSACMTGIDGHALMKKGQGAKAIGHASMGSAIGGTIGIIFLMAISPLAVKLALYVRTPGKAALILFAFIVISAMEGKTWIKAAVMTIIGMAFSSVGMGVMAPVQRFTFGSITLLEGFDFVPIIIGAFAISEIFTQSEVSNDDFLKIAEQTDKIKIKRRDFMPTKEELKEIGFLRYLKSATIGYFIGILPGAGGSMGSFVSYAEGKRSSKHPERYGNGSCEAIACAEAANNAVCGGAMVPMLAFGIPGDGVTAVVLGVLMVYGIIPGPDILSKQMNLVAPMYASLFLAALILIPLSLFLVGPYYIKIVKINRLILYSGIALIALTGSYAATNSYWQMWVSLIIGCIMFFLRKQSYPPVPFILGALLGPLFEGYVRRVLSISGNNPLIFFTEFDSLFFIVLTILFVVFLRRFSEDNVKAA